MQANNVRFHGKIMKADKLWKSLVVSAFSCLLEGENQLTDHRWLVGNFSQSLFHTPDCESPAPAADQTLCHIWHTWRKPSQQMGLGLLEEWWVKSVEGWRQGSGLELERLLAVVLLAWHLKSGEKRLMGIARHYPTLGLLQETISCD